MCSGFIQIANDFEFHRQCALVALQDVRAYLNEEGGQIAVSTQKAEHLSAIKYQ